MREIGYLYRLFVVKGVHIMTLQKELIRIAVPSTAFDPSFEPIMAKALPEVAGVVQSNLLPDYDFGLWGGIITKLIK